MSGQEPGRDLNPELDTHTARGTYALGGNTLTVAADDGIRYQLVIGNGTLTQTDAGLTLLFAR